MKVLKVPEGVRYEVSEPSPSGNFGVTIHDCGAIAS